MGWTTMHCVSPEHFGLIKLKLINIYFIDKSNFSMEYTEYQQHEENYNPR